MGTFRLDLVSVLLGLLVPAIINAQCPADRRVSGVRCGRGRGATDCPAGSTCTGETCCWNEQSPVASPCDYPLMRGQEFVTCDLQGQDQGRSCPGQCHTCRDLTGMGMGLCCPETQRPGCERASPDLVEFQEAVQRIRFGSGGTSAGGTSIASRRTGRTVAGTGNRLQSSAGSDFGRTSGIGRDSRVFTSRARMRDNPRGMPSRPRSTVSEGLCGRGIRPVSACDRRMPMIPPCPAGFYCVPDGFRGGCCPLGTGPAARPAIDPRFGRSRLLGDGFTSRSESRVSSRRGFSGRSSRLFPGDRTRSTGGTEQFNVGTERERIGRSRSSVPSSGGTGTSLADFDTRMFGPRPREDFPGGPIDTRNTPRDSCPATMTCTRSVLNECYSDNDCSVPLRCCSPGPDCARRCLASTPAQN